MSSHALDRLNERFGCGVKDPVRAVAIVDTVLYGEQTVNGIACATNDRVLVVGQLDPIENGIYDVQQSSWTRSKDFNGARDAVQGTTILWAGGLAYFQVASPEGDVHIGVDPITFDFCGGGTHGLGTINNGATSCVVPHGLPQLPAPGQIHVTPRENPTNDVGFIWVDGINTTTFTVNVKNDPGVSGMDFGYCII